MTEKQIIDLLKKAAQIKDKHIPLCRPETLHYYRKQKKYYQCISCYPTQEVTPSITQFTFGDLVKFNRLKNGMTVKELLKEMGNPFKEFYMTKIERYKEIPSPTNIIKLANALAQSYEYFLEVAFKEKMAWYEKRINKQYEPYEKKYGKSI
jgi:hypothetical protein